MRSERGSICTGAPATRLIVGHLYDVCATRSVVPLQPVRRVLGGVAYAQGAVVPADMGHRRLRLPSAPESARGSSLSFKCPW